MRRSPWPGTLISSTASEPLGMLILLLAAVSTYGDLTARFYIVRFLMPRRTHEERDVGAAAPGLRRARDPDRQPRRPAQRPAVGAPAPHRASRGAAAAGSSPRSPGPVDIFFWTVMAALVVGARAASGSASPTS